jgi:hypothetical protein
MSTWGNACGFHWRWSIRIWRCWILKWLPSIWFAWNQ